MPDVDVAIIGAGILGLSTARELLARRPGTRLVVLDKEPVVAAHQTGHNSGVVHTGIYYAPGSSKARLCVAGRAELLAFCDERGIPAERCGKLIVAAEPHEIPALEALHRRGVANGVEGLELLGPDGIRAIEPHCRGIRAIRSPQTAIVDFRRVAEAIAADVRTAGGELRLAAAVTGLARHGDAVEVTTAAGTLSASAVVACAGLQADRVAAMSGAPRDPAIVPFRGDYWQLRPDRRDLARHLIYPVPDPRFPFLGVHVTRRPDGEVWLGPNAVLAFAREGYRRRDVAPRDLAGILAHPGFLRLAGRYWRMGAAEMWRDAWKPAFVAACRRFLPDLTDDDVVPGPSGVRAQALTRAGALVDDFAVDVRDRVVHVRNAPSPAATSAFALARLIADRVEAAA
ncbi:MAG TPA: L-2-hydroxyglutarate oxidase [Candidatus Dormibacteraeota bacterium]|nr:L-2-hydroxyglutarate oxidase [Candidatus Dormibacteraeota bacterium]